VHVTVEGAVDRERRQGEVVTRAGLEMGGHVEKDFFHNAGKLAALMWIFFLAMVDTIFT
jgi:hypothetical protein